MGAQSTSDPLESNDDESTATPVFSGDSYTDLSITSGDEDYFAIEAQQGQTITAEAFFAHSDADIDMELVGPNGYDVSSSFSTSDDERISYEAQVSGTYYVRVYPYSGAPADYDFEIDVTGSGYSASDDMLESNDDESTATPVFPGDSYTGLSVTSGDEDYFEIEAQQGQTITAEALFADSDADIDMELIGPNGYNVRSSTSVTDDEQITYEAQESGTYYVRVYPYSGAPANYDFEIDVTGSGYSSVSDDMLESNDDESTATPVFPGDSYTGLSVTSGDEDYFQIEAQQGQTITAEAFFADSDADIDMELIGPNGYNVRSSTSVTDDEQITYEAQESGTYYVRVYPYSGAPATYDFEIDVTGSGYSASDDMLESNDGEDTATPVAPGDSYTGLSVTSGDEDYFAIEAQQGQTITAEAFFSHSDADIDMELVGPNGYDVRSSASVSNNEQISYEAQETGTYYIRVYPFSGAPATYDFEIDVSGSGTTGSSAVSMDVSAAQSVAGSNVNMNITVENTGSETSAVLVNVGSALDSAPGEWTIVDRSDDGGTWRASDGVWLFTSVDPGETVSPSVTVSPPSTASGQYTFFVPAETDSGSTVDTATVTIQEQTLAAAIDDNNNGMIDDTEVLEAIEQWRTGATVPETGSQISNQEILELTELWQEAEPYAEP